MQSQSEENKIIYLHSTATVKDKTMHLSEKLKFVVSFFARRSKLLFLIYGSIILTSYNSHGSHPRGVNNDIVYAPFNIPSDVDPESLAESIKKGAIALLATEHVTSNGDTSAITKTAVAQIYDSSKRHINYNQTDAVYEDNNVKIRLVNKDYKSPVIELGIKNKTYGIDIYRYILQKKNADGNPSGSAFRKNTCWGIGKFVLKLESQYTEFHDSNAVMPNFIDSAVDQKWKELQRVNGKRISQKHLSEGALLALKNGADQSLHTILSERNWLTPKLLTRLIGITATNHHLLSSDLIDIIHDLRDVHGIEEVLLQAVSSNDVDDAFIHSNNGLSGYISHLIAAQAFYALEGNEVEIEGFMMRPKKATKQKSEKPFPAHVMLNHNKGTLIPIHVRQIIHGTANWLPQNIATKIAQWPESHKAVVLVHRDNDFSTDYTKIEQIFNAHPNISFYGIDATTGKISTILAHDNFPLLKAINRDTRPSRYRRAQRQSWR